MASVSASTIPAGKSQLAAKGISHQHQMSAQSIAGAAHGGRPGQALVADYQFQFAGADAPRQRPVSRILLPRDIGHHLPGGVRMGTPGLFHSARFDGCNRLSRQSLAHQYPVDRSADVAAHPSVLSSSLIAWSQPSEAVHGRVPETCGAFPKSSGEFPNVGC